MDHSLSDNDRTLARKEAASMFRVEITKQDAVLHEAVVLALVAMEGARLKTYGQPITSGTADGFYMACKERGVKPQMVVDACQWFVSGNGGDCFPTAACFAIAAIDRAERREIEDLLERTRQSLADGTHPDLVADRKAREDRKNRRKALPAPSETPKRQRRQMPGITHELMAEFEKMRGDLN